MENQNQNLELQTAGGAPPIIPPTNPPRPAYNPLMDNVNDKPYSVSSVSVSQDQIAQGIPEPMYQPQNLGGRENPYKTIREGGSPNMGSSQSQSTPPPINPSLNNIPENDRKEGAKYVAKVVMDMYKQAHVWMNATLPFSQKKLRRLEAEGEIDLNMAIPDGQGNIITPAGYIEDFNNEVKDALQVDPKWERETMPVLERVLAKRGASMTDDQMLMFQFGKDIALKVVQVVGIKKSQNEMIQLLMDLKEQNQNAVSAAPRPKPKNDSKTDNDQTNSPYAYAPETPPPPTPKKPNKVNHDESRFNFETNEAVMQSSVAQMNVPSSGKSRLMQQKAKEKKWKADAEGSNSSYDQALAQRKTGKRGRTKKSTIDYINSVDKDEITDALILSETKKSKED